MELPKPSARGVDMHLYSQDIASVSWEDIERFCNLGSSENTYLEYKADFPNDLAKTIAAMANTFGGVILIGIDETDAGAPLLPVKGIDAHRGLEERVLNIVLDTMSPPVIPEIGVCLNSVGDKAILLVRVPQSEHAPHALHRNSRIYIRTGKRNQPEDLADIERIEWLNNRRRKAEDLREELFDRACERFREMRDGKVGGIPATDEGNWMPGIEEQPALLTISLCPIYPDRVLATPPGLAQISRSIGVRDYMGTGHEFPLRESACISRMVEDGFIMHFSGRKGLRTYHTHLNMYGLFLFRQSLLFKPRRTEEDEEDDPGGKARLIIRGFEILARLYEVMESGSKFYRELEYFGPLKCRLRLEGLLGIPFLMPVLEGGRITYDEFFSADHEVDAAHIVQRSDLTSKVHEAVLPLFAPVCWAFDSHASIDSVKGIFSQMQK